MDQRKGVGPNLGEEVTSGVVVRGCAGMEEVEVWRRCGGVEEVEEVKCG